LNSKISKTPKLGGEARGKAEIAKAMLKKGMPVEEIMEFTGLSVGELAKLNLIDVINELY
jgi:predicted transposase/invertase (TIGR01784 family)